MADGAANGGFGQALEAMRNVAGQGVSTVKKAAAATTQTAVSQILGGQMPQQPPNLNTQSALASLGADFGSLLETNSIPNQNLTPSQVSSNQNPPAQNSAQPSQQAQQEQAAIASARQNLREIEEEMKRIKEQREQNYKQKMQAQEQQQEEQEEMKLGQDNQVASPVNPAIRSGSHETSKQGG